MSRPGKIITCPQCGRKHELTMGRITRSTKFNRNGDREEKIINKACPALLFYSCKKHWWSRKTLYLYQFNPSLLFE